MKSKNTKLFMIDNVNYQFDSQSFKNYFDKYMDENNLTKENIFGTIGAVVNVTSEAVKQWYYGHNGPSELEMIHKMAKIVNVSNYLLFMKNAREKSNMEMLRTTQIESLKRIYDAIIDYLDNFNKTDGFTGALWYEFQRKGSKDPEDDIYDYAEKKIEKVLLVILKEYFYLHDTEVYSEISEYAENDLYDIFDGKLGYAYRFEAIPEGNPTTRDDYNKALKRLNDIIEKYV